jgi:hypothetical protein
MIELYSQTLRCQGRTKEDRKLGHGKETGNIKFSSFLWSYCQPKELLDSLPLARLSRVQRGEE